MKTAIIFTLIASLLFSSQIFTHAQTLESTLRPSVRKVTVPTPASVKSIYQEIRERYRQVLSESPLLNENEHHQEALEAARAYVLNASSTVLSATDAPLTPSKMTVATHSIKEIPTATAIKAVTTEIQEIREQISWMDRQIELYAARLAQYEKAKQSLQNRLQTLMSYHLESR